VLQTDPVPAPLTVIYEVMDDPTERIRAMPFVLGFLQMGLKTLNRHAQCNPFAFVRLTCVAFLNSDYSDTLILALDDADDIVVVCA